MVPQASLVNDIETFDPENFDDMECSHDQASLFESVDAYDMEKTGAMDTPPISFVSSPSSTLSAGYHRGYSNPNESTWIKNSFRSWLASTTDEPISRPMIDCTQRHGWLDSESSSPVSMVSNEQVLDALATKLAPARPQVIQLSKELRSLPELADSQEFNLQHRPTPSYGLSKRRAALNDFSLPSLDKEAIREGNARSIIKIEGYNEVDTGSSEVTPDFGQEYLSSITGPSVDYNEQPLEYRNIQNGTNITSYSQDIIDTIHETLKAFPQHMLFLDTPCVVELRRRNHAALEISSTEILRIPSPDSSVYEKRFVKFFTPWRRGSPSKSFTNQVKAESAPVTPMRTERSSDSKTSVTTDPPHPDLAAFQRVFPFAQAWWRDVLYAQLVAYNSIRAFQTSSPAHRTGISPKASRTLGMFERASMQFTVDPAEDARLDEVEMELVSCIMWIIHCMSGTLDDQLDPARIRCAPEKDFVLVRALAEIVNISEGRSGKEPKTWIPK